MFDFSDRAKMIYNELRIFEFNTGESATEALEDLSVEGFVSWLENGLPISVDMNKGITELIDEVFASKMPQYFNQSLGYEEYIPLAVLSIYLSENPEAFQFLLGVIPPKEEIRRIIADEINVLDKVFDHIDAYYSNINAFN